MTEGTKVIVLYEDRRGPQRQFALHDLVVACVADRLGQDRWALMPLIDGRPKGGVDKLLASCREEVADIAWAGQQVFALFDSDRIRRHLGLAAHVDEDAVYKKIAVSVCSVDYFTPFLLDRNIETLLKAALECGVDANARTRERAIVQKKPLDRDKILMRCAAGSKTVRECVLGAVDGLAGLVERVVSALSAEE